MGQQQSKDEQLYNQVNHGNIEAIKSLRAEGAGLEYVDREGKTPLIAACMKPELYDVGKCLIELGANVNSYRPGRFGGTPLHHAVKRGLERTVMLLLSHGAHVLLINDDCQTPLDIARAKGFSNVVRTIESHICLFAGWLRELYGPGFLEILAPQLLSRKVWVVVLPRGSHNLKKPFKLELAIYANLQDAKPRTTIALWKANMEEPAVGQSDPSVTISEASAKIRIKLAPANERDMQQLQQFCSACKGIPQVAHSAFPFNTLTPVFPATAPPVAEDVELAMAINASIQSAMQEGIPIGHPEQPSGPSPPVMVGSSSGIIHQGTFDSLSIPPKESSSQWQAHEAGPNGAAASEVIHSPIPVPTLVPSAPIIVDGVMDSDLVHYPSVDSSAFNMSEPAVDYLSAVEAGSKVGESSCVICLDALVEAACVPCGHMVGCMSCLNEVKAKNWGCPICRTKIDQVIRVYAV
ncbi:hypothetical protein Dimus_001012 [Dionaea muscipula]